MAAAWARALADGLTLRRLAAAMGNGSSELVAVWVVGQQGWGKGASLAGSDGMKGRLGAGQPIPVFSAQMPRLLRWYEVVTPPFYHLPCPPLCLPIDTTYAPWTRRC